MTREGEHDNMADEPNVEPQEVTEAPKPQGDPEPLGEGGKKALDAERRARREAEKELTAMRTRLDEFEAEKLSKEEKAAKEAADAVARATRAEAEALRWRIAAKHGVSDEDAELFLTGTDEETLMRQAERFKELARTPAKGTYVPNVGNQPQAPASLADQISVAEQSGDHKLAMALKTQQLADLARANK